jgi:hypothetical protein
MSTKEQLERLVGKVILDSDFRQRFYADPAGTAQSELGISLDQKEVETVRAGKLNENAVRRMADQAKEEIGLINVMWGYSE